MTTLPSPRPEQGRVGSYRLLALIGEGGMGVVHLAQGPDGKRVALKVLRPHIVGDAEARERLAREVSSLRRIASPRVAEILDADPHGPVPFVVTRYVPGLSLYHHVAEEGPIAGANLLHFADTLAEALEAVHRVGVLHRDIKPTNVLMEGRSPVLIDFGLARVAEDARLTQTGWLLGTPGYLAPEILYGDDATPASDVHAWAATVVFAATGRPPYGKGPAMAVMDRVRRGEFDLTGIPQTLDGVLRQCLSPEPLERPSVAQVREVLRQLRHPSPLPPVAARVAPEPELWTMPFSPQALAQPVPPATEQLPREAAPASVSPLPSRTELPPRTRVMPPSASPQALPTTLRPNPQPPAQPAAQSPAQPAPVLAPAPRQVSRAQRLLQLIGLGAVSSAVVAYAPYAGTVLLALVVLGLRTASITRQRHGRRRMIRGRHRWYDVPQSTLSLPGYALLALVGAFGLIAGACLSGLALFSLGYLFGQPAEVRLLLAGLGFTPALWWGPGSGRVREMTRGLVTRTARTEFGGWFVTAMCVVASAVLVGLLFGGGPNWAPALGAPWV